MGRLHLIRHGQAAWQLSRDGDFDSPLTELGHRQAQALAAWAERGGAAGSGGAVKVVTSPLVRARQTAAYLVTALKAEEEVWPGLAEAAFRVADHLPRRSAPAGAPSTASSEYLSFKAQAERVLSRLGEEFHGVRDAFVVTHGGMIKTLLRVAAGGDGMCFDIYNGSVTQLDWREGRWHLARLSLCDHIAENERTR